MADSSLPVWLLDSKEEITNSKEWNGFLQDLYDAIEQQLRESHISSFSDLSVSEQKLFVEKATKAIGEGPTHAELFNRVSKSLDRQLNNEVSRQLLEDSLVSTKNDLLIENTQDGIVSLLKKWPDMRSKLTALFNQSLSDSVRPVAWKTFLENGKVRKKYLQALDLRPHSVISPLDRSISRTLEQLVNLEPNFEDLKGSIGAVSAMRSTLSYHHLVHCPSTEILPDAFFYILLPFVLLEIPNISKGEKPSSRIVAQLVEQYFAFLSSLPTFINELINGRQDDQVKTFSKRVANFLYQLNTNLASSISEAFAPSDENIVATEASNRIILDDAVRVLIKPVIKNLFASHVNKDVLFYIWDQYIIGLDSPGFNDDYLAAITALFLMLLGDKLKAETSPGKMEICLKRNGQNLTIAQFQYAMNRHFHRDLSTRLRHGDGLVRPVLDPTQANFPPWHHWFAPSQIPNHMTAGERKRIRDEREAERLRLLQKKRLDLERLRKEEEERILRQHVKKHESDRNNLEDELDKERRRRQEMERSAAEEIERLRSEVEDLKNNQKRPPSRGSVASFISHYLIPPPPSLASPHRDLATIEEFGYGRRIDTPPELTRSSVPPGSGSGRSAEKQTSRAILDFMTKMSQAFHRVAGGEGYQKTDLDNASKEAIVTHRNDVRRAEIEVFGHELPPGEFERLPRDIKEEKSQEMLNVIRRTIMNRRRDRLRNGMRR